MERAAKNSAALVLMVATAILAATATAATVREFTDDEKALFVQLHNDARAEVATMPAVSWDETLAANAIEQASLCQKEEQIPAAGDYGENLWWGRSYAADWTGSPYDPMNQWLGEKGNYDHDSNSCVGGVCKHYTQVVWSRTTQIGCGRVSCNQGDLGMVIVCSYYPSGNIEGESPY
uniref:SCP domain-containing protein n=1 Tax=Leersia perrieri TaxID=77586 RepID=A0A0D9WV54_9ORYZ